MNLPTVNIYRAVPRVLVFPYRWWNTFTLVVLFVLAVKGQDTSNTITRANFNFGHQLGYMYSRIDDAYFKTAGVWSFQTGCLAFYTPDMPLVRSDFWKKRLIVMVPLYIAYYPCSRIEIEAEITDLFVEFPYQTLDNLGGKSPRFKTKLGIIEEKRRLPAVAFTVGVTFSSAKPYTIWNNHLNYDQSNGLAGAGTGVADYLLLFTASKTVSRSTTVHARIGLAPIGSPVEYSHGSGQADEIPYGIAVKNTLSPKWSSHAEISGMFNALPGTMLAHYSVARVQLIRTCKSNTLVLNMEHGLTRESDTWVVGMYEKIDFNQKGLSR